MNARFVCTGALAMLLTGCAGQGIYDAYYLAEQGNYEAALASAQRARGNIVQSFILESPESQCGEYSPLVTAHVANRDFTGAQAVCRAYDQQCAVLKEARQCFEYGVEELALASTDATVADTLTANARQLMRFRWLTIRDDYEGKALKMPIY